ncbi:MAG TPA: cobalt ABC transporter permease [Geobacteraceae bacterium]|nr:cobalt ABC transporter permease [Geobacteraceae bacterium]
MPERRRKWKFLALHILLFVPLLFGVFYLTLAPRQWQGVDEAVVEKIAREHGREARRPLLDPGEGDLLLFAFLCAGAVGGFTAGYSWRKLVSEKNRNHSHCGRH